MGRARARPALLYVKPRRIAKQRPARGDTLPYGKGNGTRSGYLPGPDGWTPYPTLPAAPGPRTRTQPYPAWPALTAGKATAPKASPGPFPRRFAPRYPVKMLRPQGTFTVSPSRAPFGDFQSHIPDTADGNPWYIARLLRSLLASYHLPRLAFCCFAFMQTNSGFA